MSTSLIEISLPIEGPEPLEVPRRPPKYSYSFSNLIRLPRRLFNPPPPSPAGGKLRSWHIVPYVRVELKDVLDGKHLSPISLKDFEEYLLFIERSPENLYFIIWLQDYTGKYSTWESCEKCDIRKRSPAFDWTRAKQTFLTSSSYLELNLPGELTEELLALEGPAPPSALEPVREYVEGMLKDSLAKFVAGVCSNSGRRHSILGMSLALGIILLSLAPLLMSILRGQSRLIRISILPCFWFGISGLIANAHGLCVIIYMFGDARQLYDFELARVDISIPMTQQSTKTSSTTTTSTSPSTSTSTTIYKPFSFSKQPLEDIEEMKRPESQNVTLTSSFPPPGIPSAPPMAPSSSAGFILPFPTSPTSPISPQNSQPLLFDFDSLPPPLTDPKELKETKDHRIRLFGPLTSISSHVITRAQWGILVRSSIVGGVITIVLAAVCIAVPPVHRPESS